MAPGESRARARGRNEAREGRRGRERARSPTERQRSRCSSQRARLEGALELARRIERIKSSRACGDDTQTRKRQPPIQRESLSGLERAAAGAARRACAARRDQSDRFGDPYEGDVRPPRLRASPANGRRRRAGDPAFGDTNGMANPAGARPLPGRTRGPRRPRRAHRALPHHRARRRPTCSPQGSGLRRSSQASASSAAPGAAGASGNIATEELVSISRDGSSTGIDLDA